jgi:hypothetical protein
LLSVALGVVVRGVKLVPQEEEPPAHCFHGVQDFPHVGTTARESVDRQAGDAVDFASLKVGQGVLIP